MFGAAQGLSYPLFSLMMQKQGMSPAMIGLSAAMMPIGLIVSAPLVPVGVRLFGGRALAVAAAVAAAFCFLAIGYLQNWFGWFVVRFLIGFAINPLYILGEVWALSMAPPSQRGRVMGVFNTLMAVGYASGPLVLTLVGVGGWTPFVVAIVGFLACASVLRIIPDLPGFEDDGQSSTGLFGFAALAPALLLAVLVSAATQQSSSALLPIFGASHGLPEAMLAAMLTTMSIGNILLQIPLGLAAERVGGRAMILFCAAATATCAMLLSVLIETPFIWPVLGVMGAVGYGVYTMALVELGTRFNGSLLVAGNSAFAVMWGLGGIVGPPTSGMVMQAVGPIGLPAVMVTLNVALLVFALYRATARRKRAA